MAGPGSWVGTTANLTMLPDSGEFVYHLVVNAVSTYEAPRAGTHRLVLALVPSRSTASSGATLPVIDSSSLALIDGDLVYDGSVVGRGVLSKLVAGTHVYLAWDARDGRLRIATAASGDVEPVVRYNGQPAVVPRAAYVSVVLSWLPLFFFALFEPC